MTDTSPARMVLNYLDIEPTERRMSKIMKIFDDYKNKDLIKAVSETKAMFEATGHYQENHYAGEIFIPADNSGYIPITGGRASDIINHVAEFVCSMHEISVGQLKANSPDSVYNIDTVLKSRKLKKQCRPFVNARTDFAKILRAHYNKRITDHMNNNFLGYKHHSSVIHLYKDRKEMSLG